MAVCRISLEESVRRYKSTGQPSYVYVRLKDIMDAFKVMSPIPVTQYFSNLPIYHKVILRAIDSYVTSTGQLHPEIDDLFESIDALNHLDGLNPLPWTEALIIFKSLSF